MDRVAGHSHVSRHSPSRPSRKIWWDQEGVEMRSNPHTKENKIAHKNTKSKQHKKQTNKHKSMVSGEELREKGRLAVQNVIDGTHRFFHHHDGGRDAADSRCSSRSGSGHKRSGWMGEFESSPATGMPHSYPDAADIRVMSKDEWHKFQESLRNAGHHLSSAAAVEEYILVHEKKHENKMTNEEEHQHQAPHHKPNHPTSIFHLPRYLR
mmetsp:Transcript_7880/g.18234  ORF Transcript_7880/g.18234 Transcript_7880/m.18234 type:complete len:209 (-) Transcript_7880:596-1222(-)